MKPYYDHAGITIYHGDCREVCPTLDAVDVVVTSPPYPGRRTYGGSVDEWSDLVPAAVLAVAATESAQYLINLGIVTLDGQVYRYWDALIDACSESGLRLTGWYVWDKGWGYPGKFNTLSPAHEFVFHFAAGPKPPARWVPSRQAGKRNGAQDTRNPDDSVGRRSYGYGKPYADRKAADSALRVAPVQERGGVAAEHPAQFPVELAESLLRSWNTGAVLDPFMGPGTTLVAAKQLGRRAIGIEIEERYCEIAAKRLSQEMLPFGEVKP